MSEPLTPEEREELRAVATALQEKGRKLAGSYQEGTLRLLNDLERVEAERLELRHTLRQLWRAVDARARLDAGFTGMGHNILIEDATRLRYATLRAKAVLDEAVAAAKVER